MKATEILMDEHRVIEQVLNCLENLADRCGAGEGLDTGSALEALDFIRNFADRCHHGKEEGCLFPLLEARGLVRERGPTGVMLDEHEQGRRLVAAMAGAVERGSAEDFAGHARAYVRLLRDHIDKEDHCLFQIADRLLGEADAESLWGSFERVEHHDMGDGTHERYLRLANDLALRLGVPLAARASTDNCCCHHRGGVGG